MNPYGSAKDRTSIEALERIPTPAPDGIYRPMPHAFFLGMVKEQISNKGIEIVEEDHITSRHGQRYFGLLKVKTDGTEENRMIGVRNSHDKSAAAALCGGVSVIVCSNMQFSGDIAVARKHTTNIMEGLPNRIAEALEDIREGWVTHDTRMVTYKQGEILGSRDADHLILEAFRRGAIKKTEIADVSDLYRAPPHPEFKGNTAYNMLQAFTEAWKGSTASLNELPQKSGVVTGMLDDYLNSPSNFGRQVAPVHAGLGWS
tara:strand:- start:9549 stop:10325 length:777 start_codon:yes stop_codon:yes gene_type:complete